MGDLIEIAAALALLRLDLAQQIDFRALPASRLRIWRTSKRSYNPCTKGHADGFGFGVDFGTKLMRAAEGGNDGIQPIFHPPSAKMPTLSSGCLLLIDPERRCRTRLFDDVPV